MELTTTNYTTQAAAATTSAKKTEKESAGQASEIFAAMLSNTATGLRFGGKEVLPNAGQALSAKFDRPVEAQETERPKAPEAADRPERPEADDRAEARPADEDTAPRERVADRDDGRSDDVSRADDSGRDDHKADAGQKDDGASHKEHADDGAGQDDTGEQTASADDAQTKTDGDGDAAASDGQADANANANANAGDNAVDADAAKMQLAGTQQMNQNAGQQKTDATAQTTADTQVKAVQVDPNAGKANANAEQQQTQTGPYETGMDARKSINDNAQANAQAKQAAAQSGAEKSDLAKQQAEDLARMIGPNDKAKISVENANAGRNMTSTPTAGLVQGALMADDGYGEGLGQTTFGQTAPNPAGIQKVGMGQGQNNAGQQNAGGQNQQAQANMAQQGLANGGAQNAQAAEAARGQAFNQMLNSGAGAQGEAAKVATQMAQTTAGGDTAPQAGAGQINSTSNTQATQQTQAAHQPAKPQYVPPKEVIDQIKVKISQANPQGNETIKIQLTPERLGKIEVKLELAHDGKVQAHIVADSRETLDLLKQDSRGMEKALQDAGLKTDAGSLSFAHREDQQRTAARNEDGRNGPNGNGANNGENGEGDGSDVPSAQVAQSYQGIRPDGRVDYFI